MRVKQFLFRYIDMNVFDTYLLENLIKQIFEAILHFSTRDPDPTSLKNRINARKIDKYNSCVVLMEPVKSCTIVFSRNEYVIRYRLYTIEVTNIYAVKYN